MLPNVVLVASDKGGAGKSTLTANLAAQMLEAGWRVLTVDLDHQGGLANHLGYAATQTDHGRGLFRSIIAGTDPVVLRDVQGRTGLDVIPAGSHTRVLKTNLAGMAMARQAPERDIEGVLAPLAGKYHCILVDTPPDADNPLLLQALVAARWVIIPAQLDPNHLEGVTRMRQLVERARAEAWNHDIEILGAVILNWRRENRRFEEFAAHVETVTKVKPLPVPISAATDAVKDIMERGMLVSEYARLIEGILENGGHAKTVSDRGLYLSVAGKRVSRVPGKRATGPVLANVELGGGLAGDYDVVGKIIMSRITKALQAHARALTRDPVDAPAATAVAAASSAARWSALEGGAKQL